MTLRIMTTLAVLLGSFLVAAGPQAGSAAAAGTCARLHMIGLRGSGEPSYSSENDLGGAVFDMYNQLVQRAITPVCR